MTMVMAERESLRVVWEAAAARREARRNVWHSYSEAEHRQAWLEGRQLPAQSIHSPSFGPPATLG